MNTTNLIDNIEYNKKNRIPTIYKNAVKVNFEIMNTWSIPYIKQKFGNQDCRGYFSNKFIIKSPLESCYDYLSKSIPYKYTLHRLGNNTFDNDLTFPNVFFKKKDLISNIFYEGPENTGVLPHSHLGGAYNIMIYGFKEWTLFDMTSQDGYKMHEYLQKEYTNTSTFLEFYKNYNIIIDKLNDNNIPVLRGIQEPGDIVYVPEGYEHFVFNKSKTLGLVVELKHSIII